MSRRISAPENPKFEHDQTINPWEKFVADVPWMVAQAREIRKKAHNYRGFNVGVIVASATLDHRSYSYNLGANVMKRSKAPKVCAETVAIGQALKEGRMHVVGLVVAAMPQEDGGSGFESPTLHCCEECRLKLGAQAEDDTLIMTIHAEKDRYQLQTASEMISLHDAAFRGEDPAQPPLFSDPGFKIWEHNHASFSRLTDGLNPLEIPDDRRTVVSAARSAITGYSLAA